MNEPVILIEILSPYSERDTRSIDFACPLRAFYATSGLLPA